MATFVLVHGGFHGGWCWKKVAPLLRAADHEVFTPTLTGLGERVHLLSPGVNLATHIQDIVNVLFYEDLDDVILVGHSNGVMVIRGVAETRPEIVRRLIYLDAIAPESGQTAFDGAPEIRARWTANAVDMQGARVYPPASRGWSFSLNRWKITDAADIAWMEPRLTPNPLAVMEESLQLSSDHAAQIPCSLIWCSGSPTQPVPANEDVAKAQARGWDVHEIQTGHEAMITAPHELAALLVQIAAGSPDHP